MSDKLPAKAKIVIIGAGIHGLSTAWHLSKKYKKENDVVVIDKAKVVRFPFYDPDKTRVRA